MILEFSSEEKEEEEKNNEMTNYEKRKERTSDYFSKMKTNIIELVLVQNSLFSRGKFLRKSRSHSNLPELNRKKIGENKQTKRNTFDHNFYYHLEDSSKSSKANKEKFFMKNLSCKSTNEGNIIRNSLNFNSNSIVNFFMGKKFGNFFLLEDENSKEDSEGYQYNQYINFFPLEETEIKEEEKDIMSCVYIDRIIPHNPRHQKIQKEETKEEKPEKEKFVNKELIKDFSIPFNIDGNIFKEKNNFGLPLAKNIKPLNFLNKDIGGNMQNSFGKKELDLNNDFDDNIKVPPEIYGLKEFKLDSKLLNRISNLNLKMNMDQNCPQLFNNYNQTELLSTPTNFKFDEFNHNHTNSIKNHSINNKICNNNKYIIINENNNTPDMNDNFAILPLNKSFYEYTDEELLKYCIALIKDQSGCRFLQDKIRSNQIFANEKLFEKIKSKIKLISCDPFGNYFLQALIDVLNYENANTLLDLIQNDFTSICISPHGTRVIQKIIDKISSIPGLMNKFIFNLNGQNLGIIFKSPYGNHTIQKFLTTVRSTEYTQFIYNYAFENFMEIAVTKHGVCVIQKCVSEGDKRQRITTYDLILKNFDFLIRDQFGNYLIQYILINTETKYQLEEVMPLVRKIEQNLLIYCKLKFPANCIEKCFENTDNCVREHILEYLINNYKDNIIEILLDQYGIYIILKALNINSMLKQRLLEIIFRRGNEIKYINLFDVKYRGIVKIINSIKEIRMLLCCGKQVDNNTNVNIININNNNINTVNNCQDYNYTYNYNEIPNRTKFNQLNKRKGQK